MKITIHFDNGVEATEPVEHVMDSCGDPIEFHGGSLYVWDQEGEMHTYDEWTSFAVQRKD